MLTTGQREQTPPTAGTTARALLVWEGTGGGEKGHNLSLRQNKQTRPFVCLHLSLGYETKKVVDFKELKLNKLLLYNGY